MRRANEDLLHVNEAANIRMGLTWLIPLGYNDISQVVNQVINNVTNEEMEEIDQRLAAKLKKACNPLVEFSHGSTESLLSLRQLIQDELIDHLDRVLPVDDMAALFAEQNQNIGNAVENLHSEVAIPVVLPAQTSAIELAFFMLPQSEQSAGVEREVRQMFPDLLTLQSSSSQDIVMHRALLGLQLSELSVMNPACLKAFETAKAIEHFTPHSRQDVDRWHNPAVQNPTEPLPVQRAVATGR